MLDKLFTFIKTSNKAHVPQSESELPVNVGG